MLDKRFIHILEALLMIADAKGKAISAKKLCVEQGLNHRYLEQQLQLLVKHNILISMRGARGGYVLAVERRKLLLSSIYQIICGDQKEETSVAINFYTEVIKPLSNKIEDSILSALDNMTLDDLYQQIPVDRHCENTNFTI